MTGTQAAAPPAPVPFKRQLSDALAARGLGRRGTAWLASRLYRKENQVISWMVGAARPTIADVHDIARALHLDPGPLIDAAGLERARKVGLDTHSLGETIANWRALQNLSLAEASTLLKTTPLTLAAWEHGRIPHAAGRHRLTDTLGLDFSRVMNLPAKADPAPAPRSGTSRRAAAVGKATPRHLPQHNRPPEARLGAEHPRPVTGRNDVGAAILAWRAAQQLTPAQAAELVRAGAQVILRWEAGVTCPTIRHIPALAAQLPCNADELRDALYPPAKPAPPRRRAPEQRPADGTLLAAPQGWAAGQLPEVLECWRRVHNATRSTLAAAVGVNAGSLTRWLSGKTRPDEVGRRRLAVLLDWPLGELDRIVGVRATPPAAPEPIRWPRAGQLLLQRRQVLHLTRQAVAAAAGVDPMRLERWEQGLSRPRRRFRPGLAAALQLKPAALEHMLFADTPPDRRLHRIPQLQHLRRVRGLTQKELAAMLGVSQSDVSSFERRGVRGRDLPALSQALRVDLRIMLRTTLRQVSGDGRVDGRHGRQGRRCAHGRPARAVRARAHPRPPGHRRQLVPRPGGRTQRNSDASDPRGGVPDCAAGRAEGSAGDRCRARGGEARLRRSAGRAGPAPGCSAAGAGQRPAAGGPQTDADGRGGVRADAPERAGQHPPPGAALAPLAGTPGGRLQAPA